MSLQKTSLLCLLSLMLVISAKSQTNRYSLSSPNKNIAVTVSTADKVSYTVNYNGKPVLLSSEISMVLNDRKVLGVKSTVAKTEQRMVNKDIKPLYGMAQVYKDLFNELTLTFSNNYQLIFRAYNNGVAYRFATSIPGKIQVKEEQINYRFADDVEGWIQTTQSYQFSYEAEYLKRKISTLTKKTLGAMPLLVESNGVNIAITEADLLDYPGHYFQYKGDYTLKGVAPKYVLKDSVGGQNNFNKLSYEDAEYVAETEGTRSFPWRLMVLEESDKELLYNNLVYLLATENRLGDVSWIKPGKVSWDWWNANNLTGVDFKSGFNTDTYKYFIDFAAKNKLEYIMMDEGWSDQFDLLKVNDGSVVTDGSTRLSGKLNMPFLFNYAKQKNVGIVLWCVWHTLDRQMTEALDQFQKWGVKGVKVDFMNRDDQTVVNFYQRLATEAAKRKMIVDFHAAFKPTGMERTYPNILNFEAVQGLEWAKFSDVDLLRQATILPFTRMIAGPMDYTPGGMYNANKADYRKSFYRPMTQGTRCNQLAMFTMYYAPFEMLADAPTAYEKEPEILKYLTGMPTIWDETVALDGKVGEYAIIARRRGTTWHIAGLNNWTAKSARLSFNFLKSGDYTATIFTDGVNADRIGNDYKKEIKKVNKNTVMNIDMADGGGFALQLQAVK